MIITPINYWTVCVQNRIKNWNVKWPTNLAAECVWPKREKLKKAEAFRLHKEQEINKKQTNILKVICTTEIYVILKKNLDIPPTAYGMFMREVVLPD